MKKYKGFVNRTATLVRRDETIKELKKENEDLSKAIDEIERDKKEDIACLLNDKNSVITELSVKLSQTQEALNESLRKKWYQFVAVK